MQMRSLLGAAALVAVLLAASVRAAVHSKASDAACAVAPTPTVTFVASCTTIDVADASCWTPRVPGASDVVAFPAGTKASMPFALTYTPLSVQSVYVAPSAVVTLNGGAIAVSSCLNVAGSLKLVGKGDNGTVSTIPFAADPSVPHGTDCSVVPAGFTPRLCGPGQLYVTGSLSLSGLYASLWTTTYIALGGSATAADSSFLWGNVSNYGTLRTRGLLYFHGYLFNSAGASMTIENIRADYWTKGAFPANLTVEIVNRGSLTLTVPKVNSQPNYELVSTRNGNYSTPLVILQVTNWNTFVIAVPTGTGAITSADISFVTMNYGTTTWFGSQVFYGIGAVYNYGELIANQASVNWITVYSDGGTMKQVNGGSFNVGMGDAMQRWMERRGGIRGPYIPVSVLRNTLLVSSSLNRSLVKPVLSLHSPVEIHGDLTVSVGATLSNLIAFPTTVLLRGSTGALVVRGTYQCAKDEVFEGAHDRLVVTSSGVVVIPDTHHVLIKSDAALELLPGAMTRVLGHITMRDNTPRGTAHRASISRSSISFGSSRISDDANFVFASMPYEGYM